MPSVLVVGAGNERYALACEHVVEVVSAVAFRPLRHVPDWICGVFNYRGVVVPALDLRKLLTGEPCAESLSTRLIIVDWPGQSRKALVGILAEHVSHLRRADSERRAGLQVGGAPFLGTLTLDDGSMVQTIELGGIPISGMLAPEAEDARAGRRAP